MPNQKMLTSLSAMRLQHQPLYMLGRFTMVTLPTFAEGEAGLLNSNASAVIHSEDQKPWCTLGGWLDQDSAVVQCRKTGLTIQLRKGKQVSAELLPAAGDSPCAMVKYTPSGGQPQTWKLQTVLDTPNGTVTFSLPFTGADGSELWGGILNAMTAPNSDVALEIAYHHRYLVRSAAAPADPTPTTPGPVRPHIPRLDPVTPLGPAHLRINPNVLRARLGGTAATATTTTPAPIARLVNPAMLAFVKNLKLGDLRVMQPDKRRIVVDPPAPAEPAAAQVVERQFGGPAVRIPLARPKSDAAVFPDLARSAQHGWGQAARNPRLHYCDSPRADTFYYAPTRFKLGYYCEQGAEGAGRPPYRVELYRTAEGEDRIKATLVALPCLADEERQTLRSYLHDDVLQGLEPFVFLEPKSGLQARFVDSFSSGEASNPQTLPSSISFAADEVIPDDRLVLRFDMPATAYAIFCELLKRGIYGRVILAAEGFQDSFEVRLQLSDVITNALTIECDDGTSPPAAPGEEEKTEAVLSIRNLLPLPLSLSSLRLNYFDMGEESGLVFEAEEQDLMPGGGTVDGAGRLEFPVAPQRLAAWDETLVEPGTLVVQGGSVEDWLNRVHRDPTMQPQEFRIRTELSIPSAGRERVQLVRVRLFRDGEAAPRSRLDLTPGGAVQDLRLTMTFEELAAARPPSFSAEYETLYQEGGISLPQRVEAKFGDRNLLLRVLIEPASATYTVEHEDQRETMNRVGAAQLIDRLRAEGKRWEIFAQEIAATTTTTTTTPAPATTTTTTTTPAPQAATVSVITDLLPAAFESGGLRRVFLILRSASGPAVQSTFAFDAGNQQGVEWRPQGATIPPFLYEITYLYANGQIREIQGQETNLTLILDPPKTT